MCEFQILACIPLTGSAPYKDVAEIGGVPKDQLCRISRLLITVGFLREPQPGYVAHSELSAHFVTQPELLDAALFLCGTAAPAALQLPIATRHVAGPDLQECTAFNVSADTANSFVTCLGLRPRLQRQFCASLACQSSREDSHVLALLTRYDWLSLPNNATVVDVGSRSATTAISLATLCPSLQFIIQSYPEAFDVGPNSISARIASGPNVAVDVPQQFASRIILQQRAPASIQSVKDAAIYLLRLPVASPSFHLNSVLSRAASELSAHVNVLRAKPASRLIMVAFELPAPGTVDVNAEAAARLRDLSMLQLANGGHAERSELIDVLNRVRDSSGALVLMNEIRSQNTSFVAYEVRYQAYSEHNIIAR